MFKDARVGDRVWSMKRGWQEVVEIRPNAIYHIILKTFYGFVTITFDGKESVNDLLPTNFWNEIKIDPPPRPKRKVKRMTNGVWVNYYPSTKMWGSGHLTKEDAEGWGQPGAVQIYVPPQEYEVEERGFGGGQKNSKSMRRRSEV